MVIILFLIFLGLMALGVPVAGAIGLAVFQNAQSTGSISLPYLASSMVSSLDSFPILAIPMFILAGEVMGSGGISKRLFNFANSLLGGFTGGVAIATVATCMLFGAISGSGVATFAAVGLIMIPLMAENGYNKSFVTGLTAASGGLGVLIPPSLPLVMYGIASGVSIGDLFIAGVLPGVVTGVALMIYAYGYCKKHPLTGGNQKIEREGVFKSIKDGFWALLTPVIILGGIYGGIFTPTEAAAVSVVYGLIISLFVYRTISVKQIPGFLLNAAKTNAPVLLIVSAASVFGRLLSIAKVPTIVANAMLSLFGNPILIMIVMNVLLLIVGCLMDTMPAIIILTPILLPVAVQCGYDPVHFGIIMIANLAIGFITPPVGVNLYTAASLTKLPVSQVTRSAIGPLIALIIALVIIIAVPGLSTWLPSLVR